jgi:methyl-accepting chemotaxis protein
MSWLKNRGASLRVASVIVLAGLGMSACATRDYVDQQVAATNSRVDQLSSRVDQVDARVQDAITRADAAGQAAQQAQTDIRTANQRMDQMGGRIDQMEQARVRTPRG